MRARMTAALSAVLAGLALTACGSTGGKSYAAATSHSTTAANAPTTPASSPPSLTSKQLAYADAVQQAGNTTVQATLIVRAGVQLCKARSLSSQASIIAATRKAGIYRRVGMSPGAFTRLTEKMLCPNYLPKPPPKPKVVARFNGSDIQNTQSFKVPNNWHLSWEYWGCAGGSGNFIVDEYNANGSPDFNGASVNELGSGRGPVATYIYADAGRHYFSVDSECSWSLAVVTGGKS